MNVLRRRFECHFVRGALSAYLDGEAPAAGARIEAHFAECSPCRTLADTLRLQARAIEALPAEEDPPAAFVRRVMHRIGAAETTTAPAARPVWRLAPAVALSAAVAVIAMISWAIFARGPAPVVPQMHPPSKVVHAPKPAPDQTAQGVPPPAPTHAPAPAVVERRAPEKPGNLSATPKVPPAQRLRERGRSYEDEGQLDDALEEYATARDRGGSEMARLDVARVYEKTGRTADALDELMQVAFAEIDDQRWEPLSVD
jgi:hypothetical protein